jgi:hypothetical protein
VVSLLLEQRARDREDRRARAAAAGVDVARLEAEEEAAAAGPSPALATRPPWQALLPSAWRWADAADLPPIVSARAGADAEAAALLANPALVSDVTHGRRASVGRAYGDGDDAGSADGDDWDTASLREWAAGYSGDPGTIAQMLGTCRASLRAYEAFNRTVCGAPPDSFQDFDRLYRPPVMELQFPPLPIASGGAGAAAAGERAGAAGGADGGRGLSVHWAPSGSASGSQLPGPAGDPHASASTLSSSLHDGGAEPFYHPLLTTHSGYYIRRVPPSSATAAAVPRPPASRRPVGHTAPAGGGGGRRTVGASTLPRPPTSISPRGGPARVGAGQALGATALSAASAPAAGAGRGSVDGGASAHLGIVDEDLSDVDPMAAAAAQSTPESPSGAESPVVAGPILATWRTGVPATGFVVNAEAVQLARPARPRATGDSGMTVLLDLPRGDTRGVTKALKRAGRGGPRMDVLPPLAEAPAAASAQVA